MANDDVKRNKLVRVQRWLKARFVASWNWLSRLGSAIKATLGDVVLTISLGVLSYWLANKLEQSGYGLLSTLGEHLGTAFVVAAIAVVGYEWKSKSKDLVKTVNDLVLLMNDQAAPGAKRCITEMFAGDESYRADLRTSLIEVLNASYAIAPETVAHRDLAAGMICALLDNAATNATEFKTNSFTINILTPAKLIDAMLAKRMESLDSEGKYVVLSDFSSFQHAQLKLSVDAMRICLKNGARIQRLFYCFIHDLDLNFDELKRIAWEHWRLSCEFETYEARFARPTRGQVEPIHEGIFTGSRGSVRFEVLEPDLHRVKFTNDHDGKPAGNFERLWKPALPAAADNAAAIEFSKYLDFLKKERQRHRSA